MLLRPYSVAPEEAHGSTGGADATPLTAGNRPAPMEAARPEVIKRLGKQVKHEGLRPWEESSSRPSRCDAREPGRGTATVGRTQE